MIRRSFLANLLGAACLAAAERIMPSSVVAPAMQRLELFNLSGFSDDRLTIKDLDEALDFTAAPTHIILLGAWINGVEVDHETLGNFLIT